MGTILNAVAIIAGTIVGMIVKSRFSKNMASTLVQGMAITVMVIGVQMALKTQNILIVLGGLIIGGVVGEALGIEERLDALGGWIEARMPVSAGRQGEFTRGFVAASLMFCVGPMAIMGSLENGLTGKYAILATKATLDGVSSAVFGSTLGVGVAFSALPVLIYQGAITLAASVVQRFISDPVVAEMTATGGILIIGIGINMMGLAKVRVGSLLPAVFVAAAIAALM